MGKHQGWEQPPSGLLPSGLLPSEGTSFVRALDLERWSKAEDKTADLISCIQPNQPSEIRRNAVADYVKRLIMQCFPCQVFTFGSVPLKTYLPDGDIDLTAFSENPTVKENWAQQVKEILESEEKNENAEFRVKEVQYIQAEVKIIKCLVENIVVDISFNQLGGLCTLCFLEEVDNLIAKDHLFKRSIILIKAWCYYESRILGAHHGLISTYALETLVLYIFNVYDKDFLGPLEVLYRFLEFFSKFDWENFCVSLRGPVRISSLPEVAVEPPRNDDKELLLNERFLDACTAVYGVPSNNQENQGTPFASKHFNVIDPLRVNNNLGRSVSRGNFFRIRSAFAFGAKKLARLLDCPKDDLHYEVNGFFMNTWDRHGSGHRPDAPRNELLRSRLSNRESLHGHENQRSSNSRRVEAYLDRDSRVEGNRGSHGSSTPHLDITSRASNASSVSRSLGQKSYGNSSSSRTSDATLRRETNSKQGQVVNADKEQKFSRVENANNIQGRYVFARTHSSPELTDSYTEASSQGRRSRAPELAGKNQAASARLDSARRKIAEPVSNEEYSFARQQIDAATAADSKIVSNSYHDDGARLSIVSEEFESVSGTQGMIHQEEIMNMAASSSQAQGFQKHIHLPLNFNSSHLPLSLVPMGYAQRNTAGMMPMMEPWGPNMAFPHGLVSSQALAHYFPGVNMAPNPEDSVDAAERNLVANSVEGEHDLWQEQEQGSTRGSDLDNGNVDPTSSSRSYDPSSSRVVSSSSYRGQQRSTVAANREEQVDAFQYQGGRENDAYLDDRSPSSRSMRSTHSSPFRSKTSSESSWDGSTSKASKPARERKGRKGGSTAVQTIGYSKGQNVSEHSSAPADEDWNSVSTAGTEIIERNLGPQSVQMPGFEPAQGSGSGPMMPFGPVLIGPGSRQRPGDPGVIFYPTGPPVPFVAMLPFYNFPSEGSGSEASTSQFGGEDGTDSLQNFDSSSSRHENLEELSGSSIPPVEPLELRPDILNSDFTSHWHNLQYGRLCQNTRFPAAPPMMYPSPNVLSPVYMPGSQLPWDSPRRAPSPNVNIFSHLVSNGPRLVPVAPVQPASNGPASVYHVDEMPRFRGGTGTYLPNPKVSPRERHNRRGNYSYDRTDHHNERDGNWNFGVKSRASGRGHGRNQQPEKPIPRTEHPMTSEAQSNRQWSSSYRQGSSFQYHNQNNTMQQMNLIEGGGGGGSNNLAYGMYPVMNPSSTVSSSSSSNGPPVPPVFMFYPYDRSSHGYGASSDQQLEMGAGDVPGGGMGGGEVLQQMQGQGARLVVEELRRSSPDQPSSPRPRR